MTTEHIVTQVMRGARHRGVDILCIRGRTRVILRVEGALDVALPCANDAEALDTERRVLDHARSLGGVVVAP